MTNAPPVGGVDHHMSCTWQLAKMLEEEEEARKLKDGIDAINSLITRAGSLISPPAPSSSKY